MHLKLTLKLKKKAEIFRLCPYDGYYVECILTMLIIW